MSRFTFALLTALVLLAGAGSAAEGEKSQPGKAEPIPVLYDVRELTMTPVDCFGPDLCLNAAYCGSPRISEDTSPQPVALVDVIRKRVAPESWGADTGISIEERSGRLIVVQMPEVHRQISALLRDLREQILVQFSIQGTVLTVDAAMAAELRRRSSPVFEAEELERLIKSAGPGALMASCQVLCMNGQRNHVSDLQQVDCNGLKCEDNVVTPIVEQLLTGTVLEVRPVLTADRSVANVELRFAVTRNLEGKKIKARDAVIAPPAGARSAREAGDEGKGQGGANEKKRVERGEPVPVIIPDVEMVLPRVAACRLCNTVSVPLGKYILAGACPAPAAGGVDASRSLLLFVRASMAREPNAVGPGAASDAAGDLPTMRVFDIRDLTEQVEHFPGPMLGQVECFGGAAVIQGPPDNTIVPPGTLVNLIQRTVAPESWGTDVTSIEERSGQLIVCNTPAVQARVAKLLADLRASGRHQVAVQALVLALDNESAARFRARKSAEFTGNEAEELIASTGAELLAASQVLCSNGQRVHIMAGRGICDVNGYSVTGGVGVPNVTTWMSGMVMDVRPVLSADRTAATLELRLSMAREATEKAAMQWRGARGNPSVTLGKYMLAGSFRQADDAGKETRTVVVLVKADLADIPQPAAKPE